MPHPYWPLFDLRVRTPRLEIRWPTDDDCVRLAKAAADGIHDRDRMPFKLPWTHVPSPQLERNAMQWWWRARAEWSPESWRFAGAVVVDGEPVGVQDLTAERFSVLGVVGTGSWLTRRMQGRGLGTEMRAAALHLAFAGLGATEAHSGAWADNERSLRVSRALGYRQNGERLMVRQGAPTRHLAVRLDRRAWQARRRRDIELVHLDPCLPLFGAPGRG